MELQSIELLMPENIGSPTCKYDPHTGKSVICVSTSNIMDDKLQDNIANCIDWIVNQFPIKAIGMDGLDESIQLQMQGKSVFYVDNFGLIKEPFYFVHSKRKYKFANERFIDKGCFYGRIYGLESPKHYNCQVRVLKALDNREKKISPIIDKIIDSLYQMAKIIVVPEHLPILEMLVNDELDSKKILEFSETIDKAKIDLSRFKFYHFFEKNKYIWASLDSHIEKATQEAILALLLLKKIVPSGQYQDITLLFEKTNLSDPIEMSLSKITKEIKILFRKIRDISLGFGLGLDKFPNFDLVIQGLDSFEELKSMFGFAIKDSWKLLATQIQLADKRTEKYKVILALEMLKNVERLIQLTVTYDDYQAFLAEGINGNNVIRLCNKFGEKPEFSNDQIDECLNFANEFYFRAYCRARQIVKFLNGWFNAKSGEFENDVIVISVTGFLTQIIGNELDSSRIAFYDVLPHIEGSTNLVGDIKEFYDFIIHTLS